MGPVPFDSLISEIRGRRFSHSSFETVGIRVEQGSQLK
jgi:hypothetical protein